MRARLLLLAVLSSSCSRCNQQVELKALLSRPDTTVKLWVVDFESWQFGGITVTSTPAAGRCDILRGEARGSIDSIAAEVKRGSARRLGSGPIECDQPMATVDRLSIMPRGARRAFVLEDDSMRFDATLHLLTTEADTVVPHDFPDTGTAWAFRWAGAPPAYAMLDGLVTLRSTALDGGFELTFPDRVPRSGELWLQFSQFAIEGCAGATCEVAVTDQWFFTVDGGVATVRERTLF